VCAAPRGKEASPTVCLLSLALPLYPWLPLPFSRRAFSSVTFSPSLLVSLPLPPASLPPSPFLSRGVMM